MTTQPSKASRLKRILYTVIGIIAILAFFIGLKIVNRAQSRAVIQPKVIAAMRADFPDFCTDGHILAEPATFPRTTNALFADYDPEWGIQCDSWMKVYSGDATIMDIDTCTTIIPIGTTLGEYYNQQQDLNKTNGQKLAVCP